MRMIVVVSHSSSSRLKYASKVLFEQILGVDWRIVESDKNLTTGDVTIHYGRDGGDGAVNVPSSGLLFEKDIRDVKMKSGKWDELPTLFAGEGDIPFDIFSAIFFLITRYEEYLPHKTDRYGRFIAEESVAFQHGFIERPLVDEWAMKLKELLAEKFHMSFPSRKFQYISTVDIDSAFAYRYKGFMRTAGGFGKDILAMDLKNASNRLKTISGIKPDAFDTYDHMVTLHKEFGVPGIFFYLLADYGLNDKNVPITSRKFRETIKSMDDYFESGIHPGYMSNKEPHRLKEEKSRLEKIIHRKVVKSRQHFLMLSMPETYVRLLQEGVEHDYSMGFASQVGFRMSTCTEVPFYNLRTDQITPLMLHPFGVMDATLNMYLELTPEQGLAKAKDVVDRVKAVEGTFISLWHNESLSEEWHWKGWLTVFEQLLSYASSQRTKEAAQKVLI